MIKSHDPADVCIEMTDKVAIACRCLQKRRDELYADIRRLEVLGIVNAKPWYKDGLYLYLVYPMVNGERKREYIGADPDRVADALAKIERVAEHDQLSRHLADIEACLSRLQSQLSSLLGLAYSVKW